MMDTHTAVWAIGALVLFKFALTILSVLWSFIRPSKVKSFGDWAVVTGATDGIGLAYCQEFAKAGLNVVLISRTQSKLDDCAKDLSAKYPKVQIKTIAADFDTDCYAKIDGELSKIPVGILVNNVGRSYAHAEYLNLVSDELVESLIRLNITSTTKMTRMVLQGMIERKKGAIVNVSSAAGVIHTGDPLYAVYSATKAYVDYFSRSLHLEYASKGIAIQCQVPYFVTSKLSKIRNSSMMVPTPRGYAAAAVKCIGYGATVVPFPAHALQHYIVENWLPTFVFQKLLMNHHLSIRKRAYRKMEKAK